MNVVKYVILMPIVAWSLAACSSSDNLSATTNDGMSKKLAARAANTASNSIAPDLESPNENKTSVSTAKKFHAICSHEPGGGWCQEYTTLDNARKAEKDHRSSTGHTDTSSGSGGCPFIKSSERKSNEVGAASLAESGSCYVTARADVELKIYEEDTFGRKGRLLWEGHLARGKSSGTLTSNRERIRYDYRIASNDPFHGDIGATCRRNEPITVP